MNVLEVYESFFPRQGGVERHLYDLCECLTERGHKPVVLAWRPAKPPFETINGTIVHRIQFPYLFRAGYPMIFYLSFQIASLASKYHVDLIHAHDYLPGLASSLAGFFLHKPVVATFHLPIWRTTYSAHGRLPFISSLVRVILKRIFISCVAVIICVSKYTYQETRKLGFPDSKMKVIYNWITPLMKREAADLREVLKKFGLAGKRFILSVGRLDKQKGFSMLIHAFHLLINKGYDVDLVIVGDGPDREMLMKCSSKLGVENRVHLLGHVPDSDLACLYERCYLFVLSSLWEGLPLTLLEAMSFGKPVVATKVGGIPEVVENGRNGVLADLNPDSLALGIERLLSDVYLTDAFAKRSKETVKRFSIHNCYTTVNLLEMVAKGLAFEAM